jgi:hypothetical protein
MEMGGLQLGLGRLDCGHEKVAHLASGFVQIMAHAGAAQAFRHYVEIDAGGTSLAQGRHLHQVGWTTYLFSLIM